jgi:hypothetical protein
VYATSRGGGESTSKNRPNNLYAISDDSDDGQSLAGVAIDMSSLVPEEDRKIDSSRTVKPGRSPVQDYALPRPYIASPVVTDKK